MKTTQFENERGQSAILIALMLVALISFLGLIFDGSNAYAQRRWMQNSADAGALAGARVLLNRGGNTQFDEIAIYNAVSTFANANGAPNSFEARFLDDTGTPFGVPLPGNHGIPQNGGNYPAGIQVTTFKTFRTFFLGVLNQGNAGVDAVAAVLTGNASVPGLMPIAVPRCFVDPSDPPNPALCGSSPITVDHPIVGQGAQNPADGDSWRGIINLHDRLDPSGTTEVDTCPGTSSSGNGSDDGKKKDAEYYINERGYHNECGPVDYNQQIDVLTGNSNGTGGSHSYDLAGYKVGDIIYVCVYPEGTVGTGTKEYAQCIGFASMQITAIDSNNMRAIWTGTFVTSGPIDTNPGHNNFGLKTIQLSK
jgi:hypothetical protein